MTMKNGVWEPEITINFWKVSGVLYIAVFCAIAVIGDLILRGVSGQGFSGDGWSSIWMILVLAVMGIGGGMIGKYLYNYGEFDSEIKHIVVAIIGAVIIAGFFVTDVRYISGKFAAVDSEGEVTCETNSSWINPFKVKEINRFDDNVTVNQSVNGNDVTVTIAVSENGAVLYEKFKTQDGITAHVKKVVKSDTNGKFKFQLE